MSRAAPAALAQTLIRDSWVHKRQTLKKHKIRYSARCSEQFL